MADEALLVCRLLLAGVFLVAGMAKLADRRGTRQRSPTSGQTAGALAAASFSLRGRKAQARPITPRLLSLGRLRQSLRMPSAVEAAAPNRCRLLLKGEEVGIEGACIGKV